MDFKIRDDRKPQGRKQLVREREEYLRLVDQGIPYEDACRIVGINSRTGRRWRNGRSAGRRQKAALSTLGRCRPTLFPWVRNRPPPRATCARGRPHPHSRPAAGERHRHTRAPGRRRVDSHWVSGWWTGWTGSGARCCGGPSGL
ncbi:helix-turn-helix domain-containing protein [Streptomyces sp. NPDC057806]|uniref:helix-turn-helix domain-containing protein n=1 Tax=Streptomyces sp. NPDC057806 TaxID=3346255 RepID=UPI0036C9F738